MNMNPVAVVILTLNEEANVRLCIESLVKRFPVIVVDSGSTDATVAIATALGCEVIETYWRGFAAQRNYALEQIRERFNFALFVDADEMFGEDIQSWVLRNIQTEKISDVVYFSQLIVLGDSVLRHAPAYPIYHPRLVKTNFAGFVENSSSHGETIPQGITFECVDIPYMHRILSNGLYSWLVKHVRLAQAEVGPKRDSSNAVITARSKLNSKLPVGLIRVGVRFGFHYIWCRGFLDGWAGFKYALMYSWYELTKYLLSGEGSGTLV